MTKTLLLLRHAKSSWEEPQLDDHQRPLNDRGRKAARLIGQRLRREKLVFDTVFCSTSTRTQETARLVFAELKSIPAVTLRQDLYHATPQQMIHILNEVPEQAEVVLLIGHNPGFEEFLQLMTGEIQSFPTAGLAWIELELENWNSLSVETRCRLIDLWRPKDLKGD